MPRGSGIESVVTSEQREPVPPLFSERAAASWLRWESQTDRQLEPFGRAALDRLGVRAGEGVLDVGCGCGQTLLQLAPLCGPSGRVVGVDPSEPMLARAGERVRQAGYANVELVVGDAEVHRFAPNSAFDGLFSRFGVMFFNDPRAAFVNLRESLVPGGRLSFVCWQRFDRNPWASLPLNAVQRALGDDTVPALLQPGAPGPFSFGDADTVTAILRDAGFEQIEVGSLEAPLHFGAASSLEEAVDFALDIGFAARLAAERGPAERPRCAEALRAVLAPFLTPRGVWFDAAAFVVTARRPSSSLGR